jgi:hypothetical protein
MKHLTQDSRCPGRDSKQASHEYKSEVLPFELIYSVIMSLIP